MSTVMLLSYLPPALPLKLEAVTLTWPLADSLNARRPVRGGEVRLSVAGKSRLLNIYQYAPASVDVESFETVVTQGRPLYRNIHLITEHLQAGESTAVERRPVELDLNRSPERRAGPPQALRGGSRARCPRYWSPYSGLVPVERTPPPAAARRAPSFA
jgi:hypothetical protein